MQVAGDLAPTLISIDVLSHGNLKRLPALAI